MLDQQQDVNPIQALADGLSEWQQQQRAQTQMTLGDLIEKIQGMEANTIDGIADPHSYRGYYRDLAFEPSGEMVKAEGILEMLKNCLGEGFQGYKGGYYYMTKNTPVWIAMWGKLGDKIMDIDKDGYFITAPDEF